MEHERIKNSRYCSLPFFLPVPIVVLLWNLSPKMVFKVLLDPLGNYLQAHCTLLLPPLHSRGQVHFFLYFLLQDGRHVPLRGFFEVVPLRLPLMCQNGCWTQTNDLKSFIGTHYKDARRGPVSLMYLQAKGKPLPNWKERSYGSLRACCVSR